MNSPDLLPFADHSQKLPEKLVSPDFQENNPVLELLAAHFIDFWSAVTASSVMAVMFSQTVKFLAVGPALKGHDLFPISMCLFPLVLFSYYFFSYFFNHGQTYGMHLFKKRVSMKHQSFSECAQWSFQSLFLCFSLGLSLIFRKDFQENFKSHDYLYSELVKYREMEHVDLLSLIADAETFDEEYDQAA